MFSKYGLTVTEPDTSEQFKRFNEPWKFSRNRGPALQTIGGRDGNQVTTGTWQRMKGWHPTYWLQIQRKSAARTSRP